MVHLSFILNSHRPNIRETLIQRKTDMDSSFYQSKNSFSLVELILKTANVYEHKTFTK